MPLLFPFFGGAVILLLGLAALAFTIWMLVDAARRSEADFNPPQSRIWWIVGLAVGIFLGWLGLAVSLVYFFVVRKPATEGKPAAQLFGSSASSFGARAPRGGSGRACKTCGEPLGTHARFCQNCGTPAELEDR